MLSVFARAVCAQQVGSIQGTVIDNDFERGLSGVQVRVVETQQVVESDAQGTFLIDQIQPGTYTLVISKQGYTQKVSDPILVTPGQVARLEVGLSGEFTELPPVPVEDIRFEAGSTEQIQELRLNIVSSVDGISAEQISTAGASDASDAIRLVPGASVQDDKAVIRGLPDRYVSSQLNGVRLPSADAETRAIDLSQFPADVIETIVVYKTFTPDQQGDASGGAVDIITKSIPEQNIISVGFSTGTNTQVAEAGDQFLTTQDGGIPFDGTKDAYKSNIFRPNRTRGIGVGGSQRQAPIDWGVDATIAGRYETEDQWTIGGILTGFYSRDAAYRDNEFTDTLIAQSPSANTITPLQIVASDRGGTLVGSLFDIERGQQELQLGSLAGAGVSSENHSLDLMFMHVRTAIEDVTIAEDTRSIQFRTDPDDLAELPFVRNETVAFTEQVVQSFQLSGEHTLKLWEWEEESDSWISFRDPVFDWKFSLNQATEVEPDKRQFGAVWTPEIPDSTIVLPGPIIIPVPGSPATWSPLLVGNGATFGTLQRTWQSVTEESMQYALNLELPFVINNNEGAFKFGIFNDEVERTFQQASFANFGQNTAIGEELDFEDSLSEAVSNGQFGLFPIDDSGLTDIPYDGQYDIFAWYGMVDVPLLDNLNFISGARVETTQISIVSSPEANALVIDPSTNTVVDALNPDGTPSTNLEGDILKDAEFEETVVLPSFTLIYDATEELTVRAAYSQTQARQTFRELAPTLQSEFLGADLFVGNPELKPAKVTNYDIRLDYTSGGTFLSGSYFYKDITDPIEIVQGFSTIVGTFQTPTNYPSGQIQGFELEARQKLEDFWEDLLGLSAGVNFTYIESEVQLPSNEVIGSANNAIPWFSRDAVNSPEFLFNANLIYEIETTGTKIGLFYTITGDTLIAGENRGFNDTRLAPVPNGELTPGIYAKQFDQLNLTISQELNKYFSLKFSAKNLTNPEIQEEYRSDLVATRVRRSYRKGIDFSISLSADFEF